MEALGVFEAITECTVDEDVEQPDERDKKEHLVAGHDVEKRKHAWTDQAVPEIVGECTDSVAKEISYSAYVYDEKENK